METQIEAYNNCIEINKVINALTTEMLKLNDEFLQMNEEFEKYTTLLKILIKTKKHIS
jgi:hypothetical protein